MKKGRYGVVHGSVMDQFFRPTHIDIETSSLDDVTLENITRLVSNKNLQVENEDELTVKLYLYP